LLQVHQMTDLGYEPRVLGKRAFEFVHLNDLAQAENFDGNHPLFRYQQHSKSYVYSTQMVRGECSSCQ